MAEPTDIREAIDKGEMSRFQAVAVALCVTLNMLDGFDVLVMSFTASAVCSARRARNASLVVATIPEVSTANTAAAAATSARCRRANFRSW